MQDHGLKNKLRAPCLVGLGKFKNIGQLLTDQDLVHREQSIKIVPKIELAFTGRP